jgi:hypothetical protein
VAQQPLNEVEQTAPDGWYERVLERLSQRGLHLLGQIGAATLWLGGWSLLIISIEQVWNLRCRRCVGLSATVGAALMLLLGFGCWCWSGNWLRKPGAMAGSRFVGTTCAGGDHQSGTGCVVPVVRQ